jgi:hypothetical protein
MIRRRQSRRELPPTSAAKFSYPATYRDPATNILYTQYFDRPGDLYVDPMSGLSSWYSYNETAQDGISYIKYKNFDPYRNPSQL